MKILKYLIPIIVIALLFGACKYDFILPEDVIVPDTTDPNGTTYGFAEYILPIFNNNNKCTSCHKPGDQIPDLTTANAYSSLNSSRYINRTVWEESKIYKHPLASTSTHSQENYTDAEAAYVLAWLKQGAQNN